MLEGNSAKCRRSTKIVCTIGPATRSPTVLRRLIESGMDVARLNFSHGDHEEHGENIRRIREASRETTPQRGMTATPGSAPCAA